MRKWLLFALLILIADQLSKDWIIKMLSFGESIAITSFFNVVLVYNTGAAFGLLANAGGWQFYVFVALALSASVFMVVLLRKHHQDKRLALALSLILSGAIGNVIDRFIHGHVIDFIDLYYQHYHWPAFNIADSAICIGAILLVIDSFVHKKT
jgi:signal peptidase II